MRNDLLYPERNFDFAAASKSRTRSRDIPFSELLDAALSGDFNGAMAIAGRMCGGEERDDIEAVLRRHMR